MMRNGKENGSSKVFLKNGRFFVGEQINGRLSNGTLYKLQHNNTFDVSKVDYRNDQDAAFNIYPDS